MCADLQQWHELPTSVDSQAGNVQVPHAQDSITEPGCGVRASVEGQAVAVGQLQWVQQQARIQSNSSASSSNSSSSSSSGESGLGSGLSGQSVIYVGLEGKGVVGALGFSDTLRPDSQYVVQQLRSRGIRVVVLSGMVKTCTLKLALSIFIPACTFENMLSTDCLVCTKHISKMELCQAV